MALTEEEVIDRIEILENGVIQKRMATVIKRDGEEIARTYKRVVIDVEDDMTAEDQKIKNISNIVWTPEVKSKRLATKEAIKTAKGL